MTPEQLANLERRLDLTLSAPLAERLADGERSGPVGALVYRGFLPLLVHNLRHRDELRPAPWPPHFLALGNDGCGNEFLVDTRDDAAHVVLYDHETGEFDDGQAAFAAIAKEDGEYKGVEGFSCLSNDTAMVTRARTPDESILHPISMAEWQRYMEGNPMWDAHPYREGVNPFTGEKQRFESPGRARWRGAGDEEFALFLWGGLTWRRPGLEAQQELSRVAAALDATVFLGWEPGPGR